MKPELAPVPASADEGHYLRQELYEQVRTNPRIFDFLQAGSLDGVWYWDLEQPEHEWISPDFWRLFGYDPALKEHLASAWQDIIHPEDLEVALENFHRHAADPEYPYDQVVRYRHRGGWTIWVRCRGIIIRNAEGKPIRMLGAHTDVTALKQAEESARRANEELLRVNEDLKSFSYSVAHDLRGPVRIVSSYLEMLEAAHGQGLSDDAKTLVRTARSKTREMNGLIEALLSLAQVSQQERCPVDVDMTALARQAVDALRAEVPAERAIEVEVGPLPNAHLGWLKILGWQGDSLTR